MGRFLHKGTNMIRARGFTLIELMMVVVILGIIVAIAYPAYQDQVEEARLSEGRTALMEVATRMERCYSRTGTYDDCDVPAESETGVYTINVNSNGNTYTATAQRQKVVSANKCGDLTVTQTGRQDSTAGDADECWGQ